MEYADAETRIAGWLGDQLTGFKLWADPVLPHNWNFTAPIGHVQRSPGEGDAALTLDSAILDVGWYAADADKARKLAERTRWLIRFELPKFTWADGVTVNGTSTITAPFWGADPSVYRRSASYRVILHGVV